MTGSSGPRRRILILDYSVDRSETELVRKYTGSNDSVSSRFIDSEESIPEESEIAAFSHVIHTGSSLSIMEAAPFSERAGEVIRFCAGIGIPQMGICYGYQLICLAFCGGDSVQRSPEGLEAGWRSVSFTGEAQTIPGTGSSEIVWQSHFDEVAILPPGSIIVATSEHCRIQAFLNDDLLLFGTQFHPEFDRDDGNLQFQHDRKLLEANGYDADLIISSGPTVDAGRVFIGFFLDYFRRGD
jgi:GMP synthase (glutamine-hydrolysing)